MRREWTAADHSEALRQAVALATHATRGAHAETMTLVHQIVDTDDEETIAQVIVAQALLFANVLRDVLPTESRRERWLQKHLLAAANLDDDPGGDAA